MLPRLIYLSWIICLVIVRFQTKKMLLIIFSLCLLSPIFGIPVSENDLVRNWDELRVDQLNSMEDALRDFLEKLRKVMKEGDPEQGIPPLEPLKLGPMEFDFFIENTTLDGYLKDMLIRNLSDFEVKNLTVALFPKMQLIADVQFPELSITGFHKLTGNLFGEMPIDDAGTHRILMKKAIVSAKLVLRTKAGALQISDLNADFDIKQISVFHKSQQESEKEIPESIVMDVLNRFRSRYLRPLLNTGKIYLNDLLLRLKDLLDEEESLQILLDLLGKSDQIPINTKW